MLADLAKVPRVVGAPVRDLAAGVSFVPDFVDSMGDPAALRASGMVRARWPEQDLGIGRTMSCECHCGGSCTVAGVGAEQEGGKVIPGRAGAPDQGREAASSAAL